MTHGTTEQSVGSQWEDTPFWQNRMNMPQCRNEGVRSHTFAGRVPPPSLWFKVMHAADAYFIADDRQTLAIMKLAALNF